MWILFGLIGALGKGFTNLFRKKIAGNIDTEVYLWITVSLSLPIVALIAVLFNESVTHAFIEEPLLVFANAVFWVMALVFNIQALKREELSYISPLAAFIPLLTLGLAWATLNESPPAAGLIGVLFVFAGAYVTNLKPNQVKWYEPIVRLTRSRGAHFAMGVSICFAIISVVTKDAANSGLSPISWLFAMQVASWMLLSYVPFKKHKQIRHAIKHNRSLMIAVTIATLVGGLFGIYSIGSTEFTAYAISLRRFDILFSIILGWKVLGETHIRNKLIGGSLMTLGVIITAIL